MAELYTVGVSPILAADDNLQFVASPAALLDAPAHEHADAFGVEGLEWIGAENGGLLLVHVVGEEAACIIAGESHGGLRQVVGAEGEELGDFRDLTGQQGSARELDHGADEIVEFYAGLLDQVIRH